MSLKRQRDTIHNTEPAYKKHCNDSYYLSYDINCKLSNLSIESDTKYSKPKNIDGLNIFQEIPNFQKYIFNKHIQPKTNKTKNFNSSIIINELKIENNELKKHNDKLKTENNELKSINNSLIMQITDMRLEYDTITKPYDTHSYSYVN